MNQDKRQTEFGWTVDLAPSRDVMMAEAMNARDAAVEKAGEAATRDGWMDHALQVIRSVAASKAEFTADDVWLAGLEYPRESRALGAAFAILRRERVIEPTSMFKPTVRSSRHAAPIRVWKSLMVRAE